MCYCPLNAFIRASPHVIKAACLVFASPARACCDPPDFTLCTPQLGFGVLEAKNGLEACDIYEKQGGDIVAVFLDLNMVGAGRMEGGSNRAGVK
jgi:hypothetical protein